MNQLPRSLFLKIFLWFGAAMITMVLATFVANELFRPESFRPPFREANDIALAAYAQTAAEIYEREGQNALLAYMDQMERAARIRAFLFTAQLNELSGRRPPAEVRELAQRVMETNKPEPGASAPSPLLARAVQTAGGSQYVLVAQMPPHPPLPLFSGHL